MSATESALGWVGELAHYFGSWFPQPIKVLATHKAVKFVLGARIQVLDPGFFWYIPAVTDVYVYPVVEQTDDLTVQSACTRDNVAVAVGGTICYRIYDIRKAFVECFEIAHVIRDRSLAVYNEFISEHTFTDILGGEHTEDDETDNSDGAQITVDEDESVDYEEDTESATGDTSKIKGSGKRKSGRHRVNTALTRRLRSCLRPYGVDVIRAQLTHFGPSTTLVHVGQGIPTASAASHNGLGAQ